MRFIKQFLLFLLLIIGLSDISFSQKMKAEEVLAKHLESIGTAETRVGVKTLIAVGDATAKFISTKDQVIQGRVVMASEGAKNFFGMNMNSSAYPGERFSFDGKNAHVAFVQRGQRSILGNFVQSNNRILEESVFGGVLSSSWLMLNREGSKNKLSFDGTKKIDGKETYVLNYSIKGSDVDVILFFDKDTFRHVRTEYKRTSSAGIGLRPEDSTRYSATNLKVTEDFTDFKPEKGLTLPHSYRLYYSITGQNGTTEIEWSFKLTEFAVNQKLEAQTFDAVP